MKRTLMAALVGGWMLAWPVIAGAQVKLPPVKADDPAKDAADLVPPSSGVYVPDSGEAFQKIRQAQRLAESKLWDQAGQLLHEVEARYGNKVLSAEPGRYVSVMEFVNAELSRWPVDGLAFYRRRYDGLAKTAYEQAASTGGAMEMAAVAREFWASSIGVQAADEAAELALEAGRFTTAIDLWSRLLTTAPGGLDKGAVPPILAKLAVGLAWSGQDAEAKKIRDRLAKEFNDWPNTFAEGVPLATWAERQSRPLTGGQALAPQAGDYPILGGGPDRTTVSSGQLSFGSELWNFSRHKPDKSAPANTGGPVSYPGNRNVGSLLNILPVIGGRTIYVSSPAGVFAIAAISGTLLWSNTDLRMNPQNMGGYPSTWVYSPTYSDGRLYVDYGSPVFVGYYGSGNSQTSGSGVACLDAINGGRVLWKLDIDTVPGLRGGVVDPSPVVYGGRVFFVVHVMRTVFDNCVVLAADARTGKLLWKQQITEADSGGGYQFLRSVPALPAAEGNTVYLCTNMGTVAALAADSGLIRWLREYERSNRRMAAAPFFQPTTPASPTRDIVPTLLWNGRVIVAPPDSLDLLILDAQTGRTVQKINRPRELANATELYGVVDNRLYVRGTKTQVACWDLVANKRAWNPVSLPEQPTHRGCLTQQYLYVPTVKYLLRLDLAKEGKVDEFRWPKESGHDGAVLLTDQQIISVSDTRIAGFCEWEEAQRRSLAEIKARPTDPDAYLVYAQHAYATAHHALAKEQLSKAVEVAGGFAILNDAKLKRQVFTYAMSFALANWKPDPKAALELLDMASLCPPDEEGHVRYRVALARYWADQNNLTEAVRFYQEVVSDPTLRATAFSPDEEAPRAEGGRFCRDAVDKLVAANGQAIYKAVAEQADRDFDGALAKGDWQEIEKIVNRYPNAERSRAELFRLAEHYASARQYDVAISQLRFLRRDYAHVLDRQPQEKEDVEALTRLANYSMALYQQWLGRADGDAKMRASQARRALSAAYEYLRQGRRHSEDKIAFNGATATFEQHGVKLKEQFGKQLQGLPYLTCPLVKTGEFTVGNNARTLKPTIGTGPAVNDDIILVNVMTGQAWEIQGYRPGKSTQPIWSRKYDAQRGQATALITYRENLAIISQMNRIKGLNPENGDIAWTVEVDSQMARQSGLQFFAQHENLLFAASHMGGGAVIDMDTGKSAANLTLPGQVNSQVDVSDRYVIYFSRANGIRLVVIDWTKNKEVGGFANPPMDAMTVKIAGDGQVALVAGRTQMVAYDLATGKQLWSVAMPAGQVAYYGGPSTFETRGNAVYTAHMADGQWHVVCRDAVNKGKVLWDKPIAQSTKGGQMVPLQMMLQDDQLFVWGGGTAAVIDCDSGEVTGFALRPNDTIRDVLIAQDYLVISSVPDGGRMKIVGGRPRIQWDIRIYDRLPGHGRLEQAISIESDNYGQSMVRPASPGVAIPSGVNKIVIYQPAGTAPPAAGSKPKPQPDEGPDAPRGQPNMNGVMAPNK